MTGTGPPWGPAPERHVAHASRASAPVGAEPWAVPRATPSPADTAGPPGTGRRAEPAGGALAGADAVRVQRLAAPLERGGWHAGLVRGPARVALVCALSWVAVLGLSLVAVLVATAVTGFRAAAGSVAGAGVASASASLVLVPFLWLAAIVPVAVLGWPAGLVAAWLLRRRPRELDHVVGFAVVGAVLTVTLLRPGLSEGWPDAVVGSATVALVGAVGAGGGRWWAGAVLRRRAARGELAPRPGIVPAPAWW